METALGNWIDPMPPGCCWHLECRGSFALKHPDGYVELRGRKARAIVAYLVAHLGEHVSRDRLIELLWPDREELQARGSLRQSLVEIRRTAPGLIKADQQHVWIKRKSIQIRDPEHLSGDEVFYGDLDGITSEFDEWLRRERAHEGGREWSDLCREVEWKLNHGDGLSALPLTERMQRIDPYNEDWLRFAMQAEFLAGHPAGIQTLFQEMKDILRQDLDVNVSAQTCALHDELLSRLSPIPDWKPTNGGGTHDHSTQKRIQRARRVFGAL